MSKKSIISETKAYHKLIKTIISKRTPVSLQEKSEQFFQNLMDYLEEKEGEEKDSLYNNIPSVERNLEFLMTKFTNNPTKAQKDSIKESVDNVANSLDKLYIDEINKK